MAKKDSGSAESNNDEKGLLEKSEKDAMNDLIVSETELNERLRKAHETLNSPNPKEKRRKEKEESDEEYKYNKKVEKELRNMLVSDAMEEKSEHISEFLSKIYHKTVDTIHSISDFFASFYIGRKSKFIYWLIFLAMYIVWIMLYMIIWIVSTIVARLSCWIYLKITVD